MIRAMLRAIVRNIAKKGGRELQTVRPFSMKERGVFAERSFVAKCGVAAVGGLLQNTVLPQNGAVRENGSLGGDYAEKSSFEQR